MNNNFSYINAIYFTDSKLLKLVSNQINSHGNAIVFDVVNINFDDVNKLIKLLDIFDLSIVPLRKNNK